MLLLAACVTLHLPQPTDAMVLAAQSRAPEATLVSLAEGRTLVLQSCGGCHAPPEPVESLGPDWADIFPEMVEKAKISPSEAHLLEVYLQAGASVPSEP